MLRAKHPPRRHVFHVSGSRWDVADTLISAIPAYLTCPATLCKAVGDGRCFAGNCLPASDQGLSFLLLPDVYACGRHKPWRTVSRRHIHQTVRLNKVIYLHCSRLLRNLAFSHIYLCASAIASKLALLSASSQFGCAAYTCAPRQSKLNKSICIALGFFVYSRPFSETGSQKQPASS